MAAIHFRRSESSGQLELAVDDGRHVPVSDPLAEPEAARIRELLREPGSIVVVPGLEHWPTGTRIPLLTLLINSSCPVSYLAAGMVDCENLFDAVVQCIRSAQPLEVFEAERQLAVEVAALTFANTLPEACHQIFRRCRELGVRGSTSREVLELARDVQRRRAQSTVTNTVLSVFPEAPVSATLCVPHRWQLNHAGVVDSRTGELVITSPTVLLERLRDAGTGLEAVTVGWRDEGQWWQTTVPRGVIADSRRVLQLAEDGFPVTSSTASRAVDYLAAFEVANAVHLPRASVTHQLGWQSPRDEAGFLLGANLITPSGTTGSVRFQGADTGDEQIAACFVSEGTFEEWRETIAVLAHFPKALVPFYASFAAPLLEIVGGPNFIVDIAGQTTVGKTTCLRAGASVWGDPDELHPNSLVKTWDCTQVWRERASAVQSGLPLFLDDSQTAHSVEEIGQFLYRYAQGTGRGRGTVRGLQQSHAWRGVALTSGERQITEFSTAGGAHARVLALWGAPFDAVTDETTELVRRLNAGIRANFGQAGHRFIQTLVDSQAEWRDWRVEYDHLTRHYEELANGRQLVRRMAAYFAIIDLAARLAHQTLDLPWTFESPFVRLMPEFLQAGEEADMPSRALREVREWAERHSEEFLPAGGHQPHAGWAGVRADRGIAFYPTRLHAILKELGHVSPLSLIKIWGERGWIASGTEGRTRRNSIHVPGGGTGRFVVVLNETERNQ